MGYDPLSTVLVLLSLDSVWHYGHRYNSLRLVYLWWFCSKLGKILQCLNTIHWVWTRYLGLPWPLGEAFGKGDPFQVLSNDEFEQTWARVTLLCWNNENTNFRLQVNMDLDTISVKIVEVTLVSKKWELHLEFQKDKHKWSQIRKTGINLVPSSFKALLILYTNQHPELARNHDHT